MLWHLLLCLCSVPKAKGGEGGNFGVVLLISAVQVFPHGVTYIGLQLEFISNLLSFV
jgi:hypothetical protein